MRNLGDNEVAVERVLPRLWPATTPVVAASYARPVAPGLLEVLALDHPVTVLTDEVVDRHGLDALRAAAMRNLLARAQPVTAYEDDGTWIVQGDDHTATGLLILPQLIAAVVGERDLSGGVLVAVPNQSTVVFQVPGAAVEPVARVVRRLHADVPDPLSPEVFRWRDGVLATATEKTEKTDRTPTARSRGLRALVRRAPALARRHVTLHEDRVEVSGTHHHDLFTFATLAEKLAGLPEDRWPGELDRLLMRALAVADDPHEFAGPTEQVLARTYPQLLRPDARPDPSWWAYARETIPGVLEVLALDLMPRGVATFHDSHVRRHGLDRLRAAGLRNLRAVPVAHDQLDRVHRLAGGPHVAATALILDEVVRRTTGERDLPDGALVAVPARQLLLYHVPCDAGLADAMRSMDRLVRRRHAEKPLDTISPHVFWWHDGEFAQLSQHRADGTTEWVMPPEFGELYRRLCAEAEPIVDRVYPRLWRGGDDPPAHGTELAPGLAWALALAEAGSVRFLTDDEVAEHGGADRLRAAALHNLSRVHHGVQPATEFGLWFVFGGPHLNAMALRLDTLVETITGSAPPYGVLVSVPNLELLVLRVLNGDDVTDREALVLMTRLTAKYYDESETCVSRRVYRWQDGAFDIAPAVSG